MLKTAVTAAALAALRAQRYGAARRWRRWLRRGPRLNRASPRRKPGPRPRPDVLLRFWNAEHKFRVSFWAAGKL